MEFLKKHYKSTTLILIGLTLAGLGQVREQKTIDFDQVICNTSEIMNFGIDLTLLQNRLSDEITELEQSDCTRPEDPESIC